MPDSPSRLGISRAALIESARVAVAAVVSMLLARSLKMPEFYWAPISTIVILLSTIDPLTLAWQRFAGTALGAALGAVIATYCHPGWSISYGTIFHVTIFHRGIFDWVMWDWIIYGVGIFICGILSALLRIGTAYRFAAITLSIVLLIAHVSPPWIVALHRFVEVSLGIAVALLATVVWRIPANPPACVPSPAVSSAGATSENKSAITPAITSHDPDKPLRPS
jgi:uncharacterized membrane protein YgaE (UPF0421/DUF939 family)